MNEPGLSLTIPAELVEQLADAVSGRLQSRFNEVPGYEPWPEWMAIETAARYLDVSPQRLRKQVARREIPFHQEDKGCRVLFRRSDLDEWMSSYRVPVRTSRSA